MSADENPTMFDKFRASADERPEAIILGVLNLIRTVPEYPLKLGKPKSKIVEAIFFNPYNFSYSFFIGKLNANCVVYYINMFNVLSK